jgi:hypothetical protein
MDQIKSYFHHLVVIYYLITTLNIPVKQALEGIRVKRPIADPNPGFIKQLNHTQ